ncbi:MAG: hypothetical protein H7221_07135 [Flavobacterium sp.]|nr:hypothetical protein [Flavobacterium sp.]
MTTLEILNSNKFFKNLIYFLGILPLSFIVSLLGFYFHAGIVLGHLPISSINDPKNFIFYEYYAYPILFSFTGSVFSFLAWILVSIFYSKTNKENLDLKPIIITLSLFIFCVILFLSKITEWFGD